MDNFSFLSNTLASEYGLTIQSILDHKGAFAIRPTLLVDCKEGRFAVKIFQESGHPSQARKPLEVFQFLQAHHYPHIPHLLETRSGQSTAAGPGWWMQVMEYIPITFQGSATPEDWHKLGAAAGRLNLFRDYPGEYAIPFEGAVQEILDLAQGRPFERPLLDLMDQLNILRTVPETGLIHGEINPANAARRANGEIVILDWDEAGTGMLALEIGYPLITNFVTVGTHTLLADQARAFYAGYRSEYPTRLDPERTFAAALFNAIRYMRFADEERRWMRIQWAVKHQDQLLQLIQQANFLGQSSSLAPQI